MAASLRERLAAARKLNDALRREVGALNKRTKKVEGRLARIAALTANVVVPPPPPAAEADANAAHDPGQDPGPAVRARVRVGGGWVRQRARAGRRPAVPVARCVLKGKGCARRTPPLSS